MQYRIYLVIRRGWGNYPAIYLPNPNIILKESSHWLTHYFKFLKAHALNAK